MKYIILRTLKHEKGIFHGLEKLDTLEGIDELDALSTAIEQANKVVTFPAQTPDSMEEDELCQISIVFVMLDYTVKHIAAIISGPAPKRGINRRPPSCVAVIELMAKHSETLLKSSGVRLSEATFQGI